MTADPLAPIRRPDCFYIGGRWVEASTDAAFDVIDSNTEELYFRVAEANAADMARAVSAAHTAFHEGPWPRLSHTQRADYLRAMAVHLRASASAVAQMWPRESGILFSAAREHSASAADILDFYSGLADSFAWEEPAAVSRGEGFGLLVREPVGVVGAIVPWNGPLPLALYKVAPALIAGCTVVLKSSPEAPGAGYILAEAAEAAGLPPGVMNALTADRHVSEMLVRDHRVDKIAFTGSTAAGRTIATIMAERIGRYTLELGGKSAAVILDDADLDHAARVLAEAECRLTGQVCASLTRLVVSRHRHDEFVEALSEVLSGVRVGDAFDANSQMGPLAMERQRDRVEHYIARGKAEGARLVTGGRRPPDIDRGYFIEPTLFADVDNSHTIAREEIFGPVLSVIPAEDEEDAIRIANDTIFGLNAAVFTSDADRAREVAARLRSGTVGQNGYRGDFGIAFGGVKQSGVGREGGVEGLLAYLEPKTVVLDAAPDSYRSPRG